MNRQLREDRGNDVVGGEISRYGDFEMWRTYGFEKLKIGKCD